MDIREIKALADEAMKAGDYRMVDVCHRAMCADGDTIDQDGNPIAMSDWTQAEALDECKRAIASAAAQDDSEV